VRMSTVIGFVGGGGIGFLLAQWIRLQDFRSAGAAIWGIALVVIILDAVSAKIRERVI
jgi:phosphonate transport system permease protein